MNNLMYIWQIVLAGLAAIFFLLAIAFDIWVYRTSKSFDFLGAFWLNSYSSSIDGLSKNQVTLLKAVDLNRKLLLYFGFSFVIFKLLIVIIRG